MEKKKGVPAYRFREQNTVKIFGVPIFQWKGEVYESSYRDSSLKQEKEDESNSK